MTLYTDALSTLNEIPVAYVRLHVAVSGPKRARGGSGVRVSGGTRDYVPINVEAEEFATKLRVHVQNLHRHVAEKFGEHPETVGIQMACDDLVRWADIWTRLTEADELVAELRKMLVRANQITGHSEEPQRLYVVCPGCLKVGGMYLTDERTYGCDGCGSTWTSDGYAYAVAEVLAAHYDNAA